ncbi:hypothetical protein GCM10008908_31540 [Clostridium subterminale]|uniref:DUF4365 domain-containing protein n=1 Tax=Clostridium subterminale TaxID=1550 RepID=A0ABP3W870_CLOSU
MNLPIVAEQHEQERRSITEFKRLMEDGNFIVRDYRESDYGVDLIVEIKLEGMYASNFTICVQLKDKLDSNTIINGEGTYTYQVEICKINYLLNSPNSIFVIYFEDKKQFVWDWIYEIEKTAIEKEINLATTEQKKYSYKFSKILNKNGKEEIHKQIKLFGKKIKEYSRKMIEYKDLGYDEVLLNTNIDELKILDSVTNKLSKAEEYYRKNDLNNAVREYEHIASIIQDEKLLLICGKIYLELEKYNKAIKKYSLAKQYNSKDYQVFLGLGFAYRGLKKYNDSIRYMEIALSYNNSPEILFELSRNYVAIGDVGKAIKKLEGLLERNNTNDNLVIEVELLLAYIYSIQFNFTKWKEFIDKVLSKDRNNSYALGLLGEYYLNLDEKSKATEVFNNCLEKDSYNYSALLGLSIIYFENNYEKAIIYFNEFIKKYYYKRFTNIEEGKIAIIYLGWTRTNCLIVNKTKEGILELDLDENRKIAFNPTNGNGIIFIGVIKNIDQEFNIPLVGKEFKRKKDFNTCISEIEKNLELVKEFTENKQSIDFYNETKLIVEEGKECVYLKIDFKGYFINGFTDSNMGKEGFREFEKAYNKYKFFQVQISCKETNEVLFYTINDNITITKNY